MKMKMLISVFALLTVLLVNGQTQGPQLPFRNTSLPTDQRVADLLGRMTLEEKVAQMMDKTPCYRTPRNPCLQLVE